jgi:type IV secretory pathway TrbF-like protein
MSPSKEKTFNDAKQLYMEQYGDAIVTNNYLKVALLALSLIAAGLIFLNFKTERTLESFKPLIIRVDSIGRAEAVSYTTFGYKPQDAEVKYFLSEFCRLYYSRNRQLIQDNFARFVYFLDDPLASQVIESYKKNNPIQAYLSDPQNGDLTVEIKQIAIEQLTNSPYKATVDFYLVYHSSVDGTETKRVLNTATFVFTFRDTVPNDMVPVNPLGLDITYFHTDEAFN